MGHHVEQSCANQVPDSADLWIALRLNNSQAGDEPHKKDYHCMEDVRYLVHGRADPRGIRGTTD